MASGLVIETNNIGNDGQGNLVQAFLVPAVATHNVTFTTTAASGAFAAETRVVTIGVTAAAFIKFGTSTVVATTADDGFDTWQPAATLVSYVIDPRKVTHVALYDGSS